MRETSAARRAARALDALRRGWPVAVFNEEGGLALLPIETADPVRFAEFTPDNNAALLVSAGRVVTLDLGQSVGLREPDEPILLRRNGGFDFQMATAIADPTFGTATGFTDGFAAAELSSAPLAAAALRLAMRAGILPAFVATTSGQVAVEVTAEDIAAYDDADRLTIAARARLPVAAIDDAEIVAFRTPEMPGEHIALVIGRPNGQPPLVRLHSECLTGDMLGSLKCDCGPQLHAAIEAIAANGWGILLYLRQEGRGIGLVNKLRAYALQDRGFDTVDANTRLGFAVDARDFRIAARMLRLLGEARIRLLTNNPAKVRVLEAAGITIAERVPHRLPANPHNARYLETKRERTGHAL
ncbi:GTP cyclohydrolase II [Sphingomonas fennica]|uniref:GTP cyclohydrolase-2 n=1 Tax=Edaphosphingomonas fennica TaxID=114404 RepID=A0A2T4HLY7_9SPHN|nr:GTP cyclohydrolase II [Sphingomonas fennica]PTD16788.1 GTP cyclohydrolase II [Sphingomonas fennica]